MNKTAIAVLPILCALPALAGEIYGTIYDGAAKVGEGVAVEIACGAKKYPAVRTDKGGGYHLDVDETGKCALTVRYRDEAPSTEVVSYDEGAQVDLVLEKQEGQYTLRRK